MSRKQELALRRAFREIKENTPKVKRKFKRAGIKADPVLVFAIAQSYRTLNKLAKE